MMRTLRAAALVAKPASVPAIVLFGAVGALVAGCAHHEGPPAGARILTLDGGNAVGIDELRFSPALGRILAPAGGTGKLMLFDPKTLAMETLGGFSVASPSAGHGHGVTSAHANDRLIFAIDRDRGEVSMASRADLRVVATARLASSPDYVRWVGATSEVWVTEPGASQIETFRVEAAALRPTGTIRVDGGPESLEIDDARGRAFSHLWKAQTVAIDTRTRAVGKAFANHCEDSRGLTLDRARGFVLAGCAEGKLVVMSGEGAVLSELQTDDGVDNIAYSASLKHAYVPTDSHSVTSVIAIDDAGKATEIGRFGGGSQCAAADDDGQVWVCDPNGGKLVVVKDKY